ncbi:MAG: NnrS family protein [Fibrobacteres bacterium]|nr:NnrS family protein [Fibrobacterota bacterium]
MSLESLLYGNFMKNSNEPARPSFWNEAQGEPYRILFPLGFALACIGVGVWIPYTLWPTAFPYPGQGHAVIQIQGFLLCFILGFLATMLPKVLGVRPLGQIQLLLFPMGFAALSACAWVNAPHARLAVQIVHLLLIGNFLAFILRRWPDRKGSPPANFAFIPLAFASDAIGTGIRAGIAAGLTDAGLLRLSSLLQFQAFPLLLILGIGGFLLPKLFGNAVVDPQALRNQPRSPLMAPLAMGTILLLGFVLEATSIHFRSGSLVLRLSYSIRAGVWAWFTLIQLRLFRLQRKQPPYLAAVRISLLAMSAGMALPVFFPAYLLAWEHLVFITGFLWITLSIAGRVVSAHAGRMEILDRHRKAFLGYGILIVMAAAGRITADIWTRGHWLHLACASGLALAAMAIWGRLFLPLIPLSPGRARE